MKLRGKNLMLSVAIIVSAALTTCGARPGPMLHRMPSYAGMLRITPDGGAEQVCDFAFDRARRNMQPKFTFGTRVVTVVRGAGDAISAFENTRERPATAVERTRFALIRDLCDPATIERVEPGDETYRVRRAGVWYTVELESQIGGRIHGEPR